MNNSYEEIGHLSVTFPADGCTEGGVCKMTNYSMVSDCAAGEPFLGVVESLCGYKAGVQVEGFVKVNYSGEHPQSGYRLLVADGNAGVKLDETGNGYWVVSVDRGTQTMVIKL